MAHRGMEHTQSNRKDGNKVKKWVIVLGTEAMTEADARAEAEAMAKESGCPMCIAEIKMEINEKGQVKKWKK